MHKYTQAILLVATIGILISSIPAVAAQTTPNAQGPLTVLVDKESYDQGDVIMVSGQVDNIRQSQQITLSVFNPKGTLVTIDQFSVDDDKTYSTQLPTSSAQWKHEGEYTIKVQYGNIANKVLITLGDIPIPKVEQPSECRSNEMLADGYCIEYNIVGGSLNSITLDGEKNTLTAMIETTDDGILVLNPSTDVLRGPDIIFVDGEEADDVTISGNTITINFPYGTEMIEVVSSFVIPEFGTITILILVVAITSVIAVSARTRLLS